LEDLFQIFQRLEAGQSVALGWTGDSAVVVDKAEAAAYLGVLSSGTTGSPRLVWRPWIELLAELRTEEAWSGWRWASSFSPESFAGVQVALQAWRTGGSIVGLGNDWSTNWDRIESGQPQALSCTPTFLDLLLQFERGSSWSPIQITLGGEVLRAASGDRFRARFPQTRFTVIYAAAEYGVLLKTHRLDGRYENARLGVVDEDWRLHDGVLQLHRHGEWIPTGDRAEVSDDLIQITGRADSVVNVGGVKVSLDEISSLAEEVPGVRRAVAYALPSSIVGEVVGLRFEPDSDQATELVQRKLEALLRGRLRKEAWPRQWEVGPVRLGRNSKRVRA
jgi:O-succinylbenzoic acid--CoA ligase